MALPSNRKQRIIMRLLHTHTKASTGWAISFTELAEITEEACKHDFVSVEQVEAVVLGMVELGFAQMDSQSLTDRTQ